MDDEQAAATEDEIIGLFSKDVIERGAALLERDRRVYGTEELYTVSENVAFNYICRQANISWPNKPIGMQTFAAIKLMTLAQVLCHSPASPEIIAEAIRDLGILGKRMAKLVAEDQARDQRPPPSASPPPVAPIPFAPSMRRTGSPMAELVGALDTAEEAEGRSQASELIRRFPPDLIRQGR